MAGKESAEKSAAHAQNPNDPNADVESAKAAGGDAKAPVAPKAAAKAADPEKDAKASGDGGAKSKMLKLIGVKAEDVLSFNAESRTMATQQGGKYRLSADGKQLIHLSGPVPKAATKED